MPTYSSLKTFIVEDDPQMRRILSKALHSIPDVQLVGEAGTGTEAVEKIAELEPDVVFMDIDLPEKDGITTAKEILDIDPDIFLIFATGYSQYMPEAFELYAFDYLMKPFQIERIRETIRKIQQLVRLKSKALSSITQVEPTGPISKKIAVKVDRSIKFVDTDKVIFIGRKNRKTIIVTCQNEIINTYETIDTLERRIHGQNFFRSHQSYLINLDLVAEIQPWARGRYIVFFVQTKKHAFMTEEKYKILQQKLAL